MKTNLTAEEHRSAAENLRDRALWKRHFNIPMAHQMRLKAQWHERRAAEKALSTATSYSYRKQGRETIITSLYGDSK